MRVNFKQQFEDIDGKFTEDQYAQYAINAVMAPNPGGTETGEQLLDKYDLGIRIKNSTTAGIEISHVEKELILKEIRRVYATPLIYKRFTDLFKKAEEKLAKAK